MSTPVKTPSRTMLPDGRLSFIVFRRDLTTSAPDRVAVRVIAKVVHGMTFDSAAAASITKLDDQWAIRGNSYDLRVAPVNENSEMLLLRPEKIPTLCSLLAVMALCLRDRRSTSALRVR